MLEQEFEERLEVLEKKVEELTTELSEVKNGRAEEPMLIPGVESDFVPSVEPKVIGQFTLRVGRVVKADSLLGLTDEEWRQFSTPDEI